MNQKSYAYYNLLDALPKDDCAVCRLLVTDTQEFLDTFLYEHATDLTIVETFQAMRGLCNVHSWQLLEYRGRSSNIAFLHENLLVELLKILEDAHVERPTANSVLGKFLRTEDAAAGYHLAHRLKPTEPCACCAAIDSQERAYLEATVNFIDEAKFREHFESSAGYCLNHFRLLLQQVRTQNQLAFFVEVQRSRWQSIKDELETLQTKSNDPAKQHTIGDEATSWRRVIEIIAGGKHVFGTDRDRYE